MKRIIDGTKSYDKYLHIDDSISIASDAKDKIIQFLESCKGEQIDELLLYFTGHGYFDGTDFYYIWADYAPAKKRQTSLQNSEIDALLRQLNPKLVIKIIDACNSGVSYIKDSEIIESYLKSPDQSFNKCYFLFSSQNDQSSFADQNISYFTYAFIQSLNHDIGKRIRYKDIIDNISDSFEQRGKQTPFFVTQADFTDVFCVINDDIKSIFHSFKSGAMQSDSTDEPSKNTIKDLIINESKRYVDLKSALACVEGLLNIVSNSVILPEIEPFFNMKFESINSYDQLPKIEYIASWLQKNGSDAYVDISYEVENYSERVRKNLFRFSALDALYDKDDDEYYKTVIKHKTVAKSFSTKFELPYCATTLTYISKYPNIMNASLYLVPILSRTQLYIFFTKIDYTRTNWDEQKADGNSAKWSCNSLDYDFNDIKAYVENIIVDNFQKIIYADLIKKYMPNDDQIREEK